MVPRGRQQAAPSPALPTFYPRARCPPPPPPAVEFPDQVTPQQAAALTAAFGGRSANGAAAPMAEVGVGVAPAVWR